MALTTNTITQSMGISNFATGSVVTDAGAAANTVFTVGFVPRHVRWFNTTDGISDEWIAGMTNGSALHTVAAGTRTLAASPTGITVGLQGAPDGGTFTVPAALIPASKTYAWEAVG
jgi:hypothetical protein